MLENINGEIEETTMRNMSQAQRNNAATLEDIVDKVLNQEISRCRSAITRVVGTGSPERIMYNIGQNLMRANGPITSAILSAFTRIGRSINKACQQVANPRNYRRKRNEEARTAVIWSLFNIIVGRNILNADPEVLQSENFERFIIPHLTSLVNDCAEQAINGVSFERQNRNAIKDIFRPSQARPGHNRHLDGAGFMVRG